MTVTGSGMPRSLGSESAATSVLTRGDIERSGARDAVQVLNLLGTALVEQQGGPGTLASVRIRGADTRDTLVLIDGVPVTDVTSGQASIQQIPADMIERVEVVRGNLSALYGANATGGVVQIFTRRGEAERGPQVSLGAGSRGTAWFTGSAGVGDRILSAGASFGAERTAGFSAINPATISTANPDRDGNRRHHATLAVDAQPATGQRVSLDLRRVEGTVQYDSEFGAPTDTHSQHLLQTAAALRGRHALTQDWTAGWRVARTEEVRLDSTNTALRFSQSGNTLHNDVNAAELQGSPWKDWHLQWGVERLSQTTSNPVYTRQRRDTDVLRWGAVRDARWGSWQANLRHDKVSDFGSATTGRLGGTLTLTPGLSGVASVSTSFTPPAFQFLFYDCLTSFGFVCSNPDLRPEKARNAELGLQWQDARTWARATLFSVRYRDKIVNDAHGIPQNIASAKNEGAELSARQAVAAWTLMAEGVLQNPVDSSTGQRLLRHARGQFALRADYQQARWQAGAALRYVGNRRDSGNVTLPSYTVIDASALWKLAPQWSAQARIENLFNHRYQPTFGYNGTPRGVFVGLIWAAQ